MFLPNEIADVNSKRRDGANLQLGSTCSGQVILATGL